MILFHRKNSHFSAVLIQFIKVSNFRFGHKSERYEAESGMSLCNKSCRIGQIVKCEIFQKNKGSLPEIVKYMRFVEENYRSTSGSRRATKRNESMVSRMEVAYPSFGPTGKSILAGSFWAICHRRKPQPQLIRPRHRTTGPSGKKPYLLFFDPVYGNLAALCPTPLCC